MPIRDEALAYSPVINSVERGVEFSMSTSRQIRDARFYVSRLPSDFVFYQVAQVNLYPAGLEDQTGPIQQVLIPAKSVTVTGSNITLVGASYDAALYQPSDNSYILFSYNSGTSQRVGMFFDVSAYPVLANKRILNVSLAYAGAVDDLVQAGGGSRHVDFVHPFDGSSLTGLDQTDDVGNAQSFLGLSSPSNTGTLAELNTIVGRTGTAHDDLQVAYVDLGDINNGWGTGTAIGTNGGEKLPWRYVDLLRFQPSATNRQFIKLSVTIPLTENGSPAGSGNDVQMYLDYCALRVIYCEEKRVAYGGKQYQYSYGMNKITMRDTAFTADPVLAAGTYLPTLSFVSAGQVGFGGNLTSDFPDVNATRQLYEIPSHPATEVDIPFPLAERLGETFSSQTSMILPQLSLHASGGPLTEPHVYGRQVAAQVYGSNVAMQGVYDLGVNSAPYQQVRYYARRFGDTTMPLTLGGCSTVGLQVAGPTGNYASTPDNAALDITARIELLAELSPSSWASGDFQSLVAKWSLPGDLSYRLALAPDGTLQFAYAPAGTAASAVSLLSTETVLPLVDNQCSYAVRAVFIPDNGAGQNEMYFSTAPTIAGPFVQLGSAIITAGATALFSGAGNLRVGDSGSGAPATARIYAAQVVNTVGTQVANPIFSAQPPGTTPFVDAAGRTWSYNGTAAIVASSAGSTATITVSEFDELPEILDGWREVTLRFSTAATLGGGTLPNYQWSSASETAGNRWEILGASAPAISGVPSSLYTQVPSPNQLGAATYQPTLGSNISLSWMPQGVASGWVTGATSDAATDAVLIFSQDPATITGVSLTQLTQSVSGIGTLCGSLPCCIPSGIGYNRLAWTASNLPTTGFGAYELQRYDSISGAFETIMLSTTVSGTSFIDFEARSGGVVSVYRIRTLNALNFAGAWSAQVSGTGTAPGITIAGGCDNTGALIFTSNGDQTGANNAAYIMQWDNIPAETFDLFEADDVVYQPMYGRAGRVAFHGTERGLEEFSRVVLLQAGAIALPSLANAADIRDLAWDDLPYVCVRDGRGNRWFSNVRIPNINVRNDAQSYLAKLNVVETTRTPYPVDP